MNIKSSEVNISAMKIGSDYILVNLHIFDISNRYYEVFSETGNTYASDVIFTCTALHLDCHTFIYRNSGISTHIAFSGTVIWNRFKYVDI